MSVTDFDDEMARGLIAPEVGDTGGLLKALHALQEYFTYVDERALPLLADAFNLSKAEVHGTLSFYHDFRTSPRPRHVIRLCAAEACQAAGGRALAAHATVACGLDMASARDDNSLSLEPIYCLGLCATAPAMMVDDQLHGRVDAAAFDAVLADLDEGAGL